MRSTDWDKIAPHYFDEIDGPFNKGTKAPFLRIISNISDLKSKTVLEVGCGTGTMVPFLAKRFKRVVATDISKQMVEIASKKYGPLKNVEFRVMDMLNISRLKERFDVIVSVNSLLMPNIVKVNKILKKIYNRLKRGGRFVAVVPSMDAAIYQAIITFDKEYEKRHDRKKARRATNIIIGYSWHDYCYGFFNSNGRQKHYHLVELNYRLKKAGFKEFRISKLRYPWEKDEIDPNPKRFIDGIYEEIWDWVISAKK